MGLVDGLEIRVRGQVQGVGFRPFVWQLAQRFGLQGTVLNDPEGVLIQVCGAGLEGFAAALTEEAPPLARVDAVECRAFWFDLLPVGFVIAASRGRGAETRVVPDAATCPDCLAEIRGNGRRRGYAFTNCTHCGPRFSILRGLPYDRAQTSMAGFAMCGDCRAEYENPGDRRFHAQPIACPACGPRLWLEVAGAEVPGDAVALAVARLKAGQVLAIKGLGGFHLACDARNAAAVELLRQRKRRPAKPFAVMMGEGDLGGFCEVSDDILGLLRGAAAPVAVVRSLGKLPEAVAPGMATLGVMLPYTPLHHLLIDGFGGTLVMTSGNLSGEPQVIGNDEAREKLSGFADAFLLHDREIVRRLDDGVVRADPPMVLRRARGAAPGTLPLPPGFDGAGQVLALGGQMKAAICLVKNGQALLSHHLGELEDALSWEEYLRACADYGALFDLSPDVVACDRHPGYRASRHAETLGLPVVRVGHHHAHLAACLGDNLWPRDGGQVVGIVLDGTGLGQDGTIWGGEVLLGDYAGVTRVGYLRPAALPGGDAASREPWRNLLVRLDQAGLSGLADEVLTGMPLGIARAAVKAGMNAPLSSSAGRLFDAFAAALGICVGRQSYEGEAAMRLEAMVAGEAGAYAFGEASGVIDPAPMWQAWAADRAAGVLPGVMAARFHAGLAAAFCAVARRVVESGQAQAVVLSGGCFQNPVLLRACLNRLKGMKVLTHRTTPANDGGLALGQALIAAAQRLTVAESG
nr:carbamoyltransferase HypF [Rhodobacter sp. SW2]